jgi:hypothetical protein
MDLFKLDHKANIEVNLADVLIYDSFNRLYKADPTSDKKIFKSQLGYMYFMLCPRAVPFQKGMNKADAHSYSIKHSNLENIKYLENQAFKDAIKIYKDSLGSPSDELIENSLKLLRNTNRLVTKMRIKLDEIIADDDVEISVYTSFANDLNDIMKSIPVYVNTLDTLFESKIKEEGVKRKIRGGREWRDSMDGKGFGDESDGVSSPERVQ